MHFLTPEEQVEIRVRYPKERVTVKGLAEEYGTTKREIRKALGKVVVKGRGKKLDPDKVRAIRAEYAAARALNGRPNATYASLAQKYSVHPLTIYYVISRRTWKSVP